MPHKVFRDAGTGQYVHREYASQNPDTTVAEEISGELRAVVLTNDAGHVVTDHVPVEHLDEYIATATRDPGEDADGHRLLPWRVSYISQGHDSGPGGDDQHFHKGD